MAIFPEVGELLSIPEGKRLEFKRDLSSPKSFIKTLVAFANTAGGIMIIGVKDKSKDVIGVQQPLDEEERLCSLIADNIEPRLVPNVELIPWKNKTLLAVEVYPSGSRPHWVRNEGMAAGVYVRLGSTNRQADRELIEELKRGAEGIVFDEQPLPDMTTDALDLKAAQAFFGDGRRLEQEALRTLKLLTQAQGRLVPTIGGLLLFGRRREERFPDAWVQCGRFIGSDKSDIFDHAEIYGHLPGLVDSVIQFLKKHAMRGADFSEIRRRDVWSIPLGIIREVVINAVVHTDYSQIGAPIRVAFFDDRIEVENPGILVPGLTIEDIRRGVSRLRNRVITRVFRELGLIEQWGSGIPRIFKEAEKSGLPEPKIEEIGMRYRFTVYLPQAHTLKMGEKQSAAPTNGHVAEQVTEQVAEQVAEQVVSLLACLKEKPLSGREMMDRLGLKHRPTFLYDYLQPAHKEGLVMMTQPEAPKSPTQKYLLTEKGALVLSDQELR